MVVISCDNKKSGKEHFYHQFTTLFHAPARFLSLGLLIPRLLFFYLNGFEEGCVVLSCFSSLNDIQTAEGQTRHRGLGATLCF